MKRLWYLVPGAFFVLLGIQSCATVPVGRENGKGSGVPPAPPPRPSVNHVLHGERDLLCADCHDPKETGSPAIPAAETCFECHEDLEKEPDRVRAYFDATRQPDGSYLFPRLSYQPGLIVPHATHAKYEIDCAECHGTPTSDGFKRPGPLPLMDTCTQCHEKRKASNECSVCHEELRKDKKPPDHDSAFLRTHKGKAPADWREGGPSTCAICHAVPEDCSSCHKATKPPSHREAGWKSFHGRGQSDADEPFAQSSCSLCHEEQSCVRCHQTTKPRSHTSSFVRRLHGIDASVERQSCGTCHKQDSCDRCHQTTEPLSHRGSWGSGQQTHCIGCHEPLAQSSCFVCHKSTLGHLDATPLPVDGTHSGASDPSDCRECHMVLPHLDGGERCRSCHR